MTATPASWLARFAARPDAFAWILVLGIGLRLGLAFGLLPGLGHLQDLRYHATWMLQLAASGPGSFYAPGTPVLPPGFLWVLWPLGHLANVLASLTGLPAATVALVVAKLPATVADAWIAVLLWWAVGRWQGRSAGLLAATLFLAAPPAWYESAIWGQVDSVGALLVLGAVVAVIERRPELALAFAAAATLVKPQFGVAAFVVAIVLVRRHLRRGQLPDGPVRLLSSGAVALIVGLLLIVPFDIEVRGPAGLAGVPIVGDVAGLIQFVRAESGACTPLTANAFNPWILAGPDPLFRHLGDGWTFDSIRIVDGIRAWTLAAILIALLGTAVGMALVRRLDRRTILIALTVAVVGFFVLPTRVHERYLFPAVVVAAPLAATERAWRIWYALLAGSNLVNLHAVLGFGGSPSILPLPLADLAAAPATVAALAILDTALFGWAAWQLYRAARGDRPDASPRSPAYPSPETRLGGGHP